MFCFCLKALFILSLFLKDIFIGIKLEVGIYFLSSHCLLIPLFLLEKPCLWFSSAFNNTSRWFSSYLRCLSSIDPLESVAWCLLSGSEYFFWYCFCPTLSLTHFWDSRYLYVRAFPVSLVLCTFLSFSFFCFSSGWYLLTCFLVHLVFNLLLTSIHLLLISYVFILEFQLNYYLFL